MYRHIIFDIDGTLIDTEYAILHSLKNTIEALQNREVLFSELEFALGIPGDAVLARLGIKEVWVDKANQLWDEYYQLYLSSICLFDGIEQLLNQLKNSGYQLGIITSRSAQECFDDCVFQTISHYFDCIIKLNDYSKPKPNPMPLNEYLKRTGIKNNNAIYVGDTMYDAQCAKSAGVDFALALWGKKENTLGHDGVHICQTPNDIAKLLKKGSR